MQIKPCLLTSTMLHRKALMFVMVQCVMLLQLQCQYQISEALSFQAIVVAPRIVAQLAAANSRC